MNSNRAAAGPVEENVGTQASVGPCGFVYLYPGDTFPVEEASLLGNLHAGGEVFSLPLLSGLTVEADFNVNVKAVHKKLDPATVSVKASAYHREVIVFANAACFKPIFAGPGLEGLCAASRQLFGYAEFEERAGGAARPFELADLGHLLPGAESHIAGVVVTESFKERLYRGQLVVVESQIQSVRVGECDAFKVPLYDGELFAKSPCRENLRYFYHAGVSRYLFEAHYTSLAQALRVRDVPGLIGALERQSFHDQYKLPKVYECREFPATGHRGAGDCSLTIVDSVATELAVSYGLSFLEVPQEGTALLSYDKWPIFEGCETPEQRVEALTQFNAKQAVHVHSQLFSGNSVLYLARVQKQASNRGGGGENVYNSFFMGHGLACLAEPTQKENGLPSFPGVPASALSGSNYSLHHLAYAASFSPQMLARHCYYLQFAQHQKSSNNSGYNVPTYVGTAANTPMCELCRGSCPASCVNTLFYRLRDRFPPVVASVRRDPYVVTGVAGAYNDLDIAGNFANYRDKDEESNQSEEREKFTYWQVTQTVLERLSEAGICEGGEDVGDAIHNIGSFLKVFKEIDGIVDGEVARFINSMVKNNVNYRESIKSIHHIVQYVCNVYWQPPCPVFLNLYYRCVLAVVQDICLPTCMMYEQENPAVGVSPGEWLKMHYQTLWTNFKNSCIDKGVLTGTEYKVVHKDQFCDFFDVDSAARGEFVSCKTQVRISRALMMAPRVMKIKNRIIFSNSPGTESIQNAFVRGTPKGDSCVVSGPYMRFLSTYHSQLFPGAKISPLFLWHTFSKKRQLPVFPNVPRESVTELANYVEQNSRLHGETSIIDVVPENFYTYAKVRLNNALFRACGQTQFYATTIHCLTPKIQTVPAEEYPHALGARGVADVGEYLGAARELTVPTVQCTSRDNICEVGKCRPIVTLPLVVNKYTGVTGNSQIFQCANLGYFIGRGVDKNLIPDAGSFKKQGVSTSMRKRHVFMTPLSDHLLRRSVQGAAVAFEIEGVRRRVQQILSDGDNPHVIRDVVLQLVKSLGSECRSVSEYDLEYYMGQYYIFAGDVSERLQRLSDLGGDWSEEWALSVLGEEEDPLGGELEFEKVEDAECLGHPQQDEFALAPQAAAPQYSGSSSVAGKKRKANVILGDLDL
ncbi:single-stranded DNA-binding protein [Equid gammaherpesvirus 2]|nr:single-stranded DNA-binding protein [Equid gammaherpesvirus 2]